MQYNTWIRPLIAEPAGDQALYLRAPNSIICDWVKDKYGDIISEAWIKQSKAPQIQIVYGVGDPLSLMTEQATKRDEKTPAKNKKLSSKINGETPHAFRNQLDLKSEYIFNNFVSGESNEIARSYAEQVAEHYGESRHNPLMIYGGVGLGKTHLMHAIGNHVQQRNPHARIVLCRAEAFVNDMLKSIKLNAMEAFHHYYRSADILLLDDVQFFAGKERSQREVFHAIEHLHHNASQMVITCDRYPSEIPQLDARLRSRFIAGLSAIVEPPDLETRTAIVMLKAEQAGFHLPEDSALYIAQQYRASVRELEGGLNGVIARANFTGRDIDLELTRQALADVVNSRGRGPSLAEIKKRVADYYQIRVAALDSKQRTRSLARARQMAMSLARELTSLSLLEIGRDFGGRDHTTVLHASRKIEQLRRSDETIDSDFRNLMRALSN